MNTADQILEKLKATKRPIKQQYILQLASNSLPPGELTKLYLQLRKLGGKELCLLAPEYRHMTARPRRVAAAKPQLTAHKEVGVIQVYETEGVPKAKKTFFVILSGKEGGFFIPFAAFLANLPKAPKDLLVIRTGMERYYRDGIEGIGTTPYEVCRNIAKTYDTSSYERVVVIGISVGGIYALRLGELLGAKIALSLAGVYAHDAFKLGQAVKAGSFAFDPLCNCRNSSDTRLINVFSTKNEFDHLASLRLKEIRPNVIQHQLLRARKHNVLAEMLDSGTLALFLRVALAKPEFVLRVAGYISNSLGGRIRKRRLKQGKQKVQSWYLKDRI